MLANLLLAALRMHGVVLDPFPDLLHLVCDPLGLVMLIPGAHWWSFHLWSPFERGTGLISAVNEE